MKTNDLMKYAMGANGMDGVAILSGDAGGSDYWAERTGPLSKTEVAAVIGEYLDNEDDAEMVAALREELADAEAVAEIAVAHAEKFCAWRVNELADALLRDCPDEAVEDHNAVAQALRSGADKRMILGMAELNAWPESYVWLKGQMGE